AVGPGTGAGGTGAGGTGPGGQAAGRQGALFEDAGTGTPDARAMLDALIETHADQLRRIAADEHPAGFAALGAAQPAGGGAAPPRCPSPGCHGEPMCTTSC